MSKIIGLHAIFRKFSVLGSNMGFHANKSTRSPCPWEMLKPRVTDLVVIEGNLISQSYMDEVVLLFLC